jgi:hypothetical protein
VVIVVDEGEEAWVRNYESLAIHLDEVAAEHRRMKDALVKIAGTPTKGSEQVAHNMADEAMTALNGTCDA